MMVCGVLPRPNLSRPRRKVVVVGLALVLAIGCKGEPPGVEEGASPARTRVTVQGAKIPVSVASAATTSAPVLGTLADSMPFEPTGLRIGSIAWRTWIYTDVGPRRTRYGYLRAGAVVDARGPAIENEGCAGGWYRINPRGFVCLGRGATLDLEHPVIQSSDVRARRGEGLPYFYALSGETAPHLYFRLPSREQMVETEGAKVLDRAANWQARAERTWLREFLGGPHDPPTFLERGGKLEKPYGVKKPLRYVTHAGQASSDSGFAIQRTFVHAGREFGLTTELDVIPLDRTEVVRPSEFSGIVLSPDGGLPVAFVHKKYATLWEETESGSLRPHSEIRTRKGYRLTGEKKPGNMLKTSDGFWIVGSTARILEPRTSFPSFATGDRKWIDVSIKQQSLVAYVGRVPVYATLISSGRGGLGDPETEHATVRGTFMIHRKEVTSTMDGDEDRADSFNLLDVPFVQYFHRGFALHGTYWHDDFGRIRSHGCVNLSPKDAAWLFEWTDPQVPDAWHATINKERGTVVHIHP